jgi:valyl-tRNA synthetase
MESVYNSKKHEKRIYRQWEKSGAFSPGNKNNRTFCIIMPPPNANDPLHIGHAMFITIEDILIRYYRMMGYSALWLPGTDHAGIETQYVFEKKLAKEGKSRFDFDRVSLYKAILKYVRQNSGIAIQQMKAMGASADWSRFKFTLDPKIVDLVIDTFIKLYNDGLVYRGERLVNYCTKCGTGYSDLEVNYIEETTKLYYIKYGPFVLATTRPETKFADTAVAVHPNDKRYSKYVGKVIEAEGLLGKFTLKVIADPFVDPKFGTGVVKITPYHDFDDWEVWQRHKDELPQPKLGIDFDGRLTSIAGKYEGLKTNKAREIIEKDLQKKGLLARPPEEYTHNIGVCYRCKTPIEPLPLPQFFIKVKDKKINLVDRVLKSLDTKETIILGPGREKILRTWLKNLKDWNVSRKIVWGIRIPVWYNITDNPEIEVTFIDKAGNLIKGSVGKLLKKYSITEIKKGLQNINAPRDCNFIVSKKSPGKNYLQETDTFDTWFSSAQWPVATLKTNKVSDFKRFYPTSVMETGYDILPFWVMRMMMLGIYLTGKSPFKIVYLHGLIRDEQGRKMSKSVGNVINPIDMVDKYGADALRMALVMGSTPGADKNVGESQIRGMRNFSNKIWNATRFVASLKPNKTKGKYDKHLSQSIESHIKDVTKSLQNFRIGLAAEKLYNWFWHVYCDKYIELAKKGLVSPSMMKRGLLTSLKLIHPFMPFVTEASWSHIADKPKKRSSNLLISESWPRAN